jgi:serine/threonine protein phosphatase PrpC
VRFEDVLEFASCTDAGLIRPQNEDSLVFDAANGFAILADGMGGYNAGEVASALTVELICAGLKSALPAMRKALAASEEDLLPEVALLLRQQIDHANAQILQQSKSRTELAGMGTTLVTLVFCDKHAVVAHVGDSRLYRLRGQRFKRLTQDHTVLQARIDRGEITSEMAARMPHKGLLTHALGVETVVQAEMCSVDVLPGDIFLLCSDGLSDMLQEKEIQQALSDAGSDLSASAQQLVAMANDYGGLDNVSVVLVRIIPFPN